MKRRPKGNITQRGNSWRVKIELPRDANGKWRFALATVKDKDAAETKLNEMLADIGNDRFIEPSKVTVGEFVPARVDQWEVSGSITARTAQRYREVVAAQIVPFIGDRSLQKLKPLDIEGWHSDLRARGRKDGNSGVCARTIRHAHGILGKAINDALKNELVAKNVCRLESAPEVTDREMVIVQDVPGLVAELRGERLRVPAMVALFTGMRRGEVLALRWSRVDLDHKVIEVVEALEETKAHGVRFKKPKSKAGSRSVSLPDILTDALRDHRKDQLEMRIALGMGRLPEDALLFGNLDGTPSKPSALSASWVHLADRIGMPEVSFHALRHTHASQLIDAGIDIVTISRRLGHAKPDITLRVYAHLFKKDDSKAAAAINSAFGA